LDSRIYCRKKNGYRYCYGKNVFNPGVNDLLTINPKLAAEWDYEKNNGLKPEDVSANTRTKAWWRCEKGHNYKAIISNRNNGTGCPICANKLLLKGYNDLLTVDPELCKTWDYEKNAPLMPDELVANSPQIVWWYCHIQRQSWQASVLSRRQGAGCPYCSGKAVLIGFNDFKTKCPNLADEWDYEKNNLLRPEQVTIRAIAKVWWKCKKGHSYISRVYNRYNGSGCPYCAGNLPIVGETDLATVRPELVPEWDYDKNFLKRPEYFTSQSNMKVWWVCKEGHSWETFIYDRHNGTGCPYCARKLAITGVNDAATIAPHLIDEWDIVKNKDANLNEILLNSGKKF
jgi:glutaredoxin